MVVRRIAITGGQGVGKSTFAKRLLNKCRAELPLRCELLDGLGEDVRKQGYFLGAAADADAVAAVALAHLRRERTASGDIALFDRCMVDMLAYIRTLGVVRDPLLSVYAEVARVSLKRFDVVFRVLMADSHRVSHVEHESNQFRIQADEEIDQVIRDLGVEATSVDIHDPNYVERAFDLIRRN